MRTALSATRVTTRPMANRRIILLVGAVALLNFAGNAVSVSAPRAIVQAYWIVSTILAFTATIISEMYKVRRAG